MPFYAFYLHKITGLLHYNKPVAILQNYKQHKRCDKESRNSRGKPDRRKFYKIHLHAIFAKNIGPHYSRKRADGRYVCADVATDNGAVHRSKISARRYFLK